MTTRLRDESWMARAFCLARRGEGLTRPNPPVGAVVVRRGRVVGQGFHEQAGGPHAEVVALDRAGRTARGATLYVTLEPCSTWGRTPPCTDRVLASGLSRVVVSVRDPNPRHEGRGIRLLRRVGLDVVEGVLREDGAELIAPFARWIATGLPLVALKMAATLDGRIADRRGLSRWITCEASRRYVQDLRRRSDAVLVGSGTVRADDPSLTCRLRGHVGRLVRVVVDSRGSLPLTAKVLTDEHARRTIVATTGRCPEARCEQYRRRGAAVWVLASRRGRVSLRALMRRLGRMGMLRVLCEGGARMAEALIRETGVDELHLMIAPRVLGGGPPVTDGPGWLLGAEPRFRITGCSTCGTDVLVRAVPVHEVEKRPCSRG